MVEPQPRLPASELVYSSSINVIRTGRHLYFSLPIYGASSSVYLSEYVVSFRVGIGFDES